MFSRAVGKAAVKVAVGRTPEAVAATDQTGSGGAGPGSQAGSRSARRFFQVAQDKLRVWAAPSCPGIYPQKRHHGRFAPLSRLRAASNWWSSPISCLRASSSSFRSSIRSSYDRSKALFSGASGISSSKPFAVWGLCPFDLLFSPSISTFQTKPWAVGCLWPLSWPLASRRLTVWLLTWRTFAASEIVICIAGSIASWVANGVSSGHAVFKQFVDLIEKRRSLWFLGFPCVEVVFIRNCSARVVACGVEEVW